MYAYWKGKTGSAIKHLGYIRKRRIGSLLHNFLTAGHFDRFRPPSWLTLKNEDRSHDVIENKRRGDKMST
jgi:hypothetical protein